MEQFTTGHDQQIRNHTEFVEGDMALLYNSRLRLPLEKLKSWWYGPFMIKSLLKTWGIVLVDHKNREITVNRRRVKHYRKGNVELMNNGDIIF